MTDRVKAITVILERDNREDDVQALCDAIMLFQGVASVEKQLVTMEDAIARIRVKREMEERIWKALDSAQESKK